MNQPTRRRRTAWRGATRTLAIATAMAALIATLSAGQALATPDERVLERQGRIDRQATADQATTQAFEARFDEGFGLAPAHPCPTTELFSFCGTGTITGFGGATTLTEVVSFENFDPATSCADVVLRRTMTLEDGSTLVLMETGTVCFPGKSSLAPGAAKSFGNPFNIEATFTIVTGTGVFVGAQGSGTDVIKAAGDTGHSRLSGSITLP